MIQFLSLKILGCLTILVHEMHEEKLAVRRYYCIVNTYKLNKSKKREEMYEKTMKVWKYTSISSQSSGATWLGTANSFLLTTWNEWLISEVSWKNENSHQICVCPPESTQPYTSYRLINPKSTNSTLLPKSVFCFGLHS